MPSQRPPPPPPPPLPILQGLLIPLCQAGDCTLREAVVVASVLKRVSLPALHAAAALLRLASLPYAGTTSFFLRVLLDKRYALPYRVVDGLVDHFASFRADARQLPVVWHQSLLCFVQRYGHEVRDEDREGLKALCRAQYHHAVTPEVQRALAAAAPPPLGSYAYRRAVALCVDGCNIDADPATALRVVRAPDAPAGAPGFAPPDADAVAWGEAVDAAATVSYTGQLHCGTRAGADDGVQMYGAGLVEGFLTAPAIADYFLNTRDYFVSPYGLNASLANGELDWLRAQDGAARAAAAAAGADADESLQALRLLLLQFDGLVAGYQAAVEEEAHEVEARGGVRVLPTLTPTDFLFLNGNGDLYDLIERFRPAAETPPPPSYARLATAGRCSALVAVAPDVSDLFIGHAVWDSLSQATKIYKHFATRLALGGPGEQRVSFSSFPGELSSDDDFYLTTSPRASLAIVSTTLHILDPALYAQVSPPRASLLCWQRARVATLLARSGAHWASLFAAQNSGTYNNEWLVVDLGRFEPGGELKEGLLTVVDQIPGLVTAADRTRSLERGYWPSYNLPSDPRVYNACGLGEKGVVDAHAAAAGGAGARWLSYQLAPRAALFRRDGGGIASLSRLRDVVRGVHRGAPGAPATPDPLARGDALASVCGRADLETDPASREPRGCFDGKATSWREAVGGERGASLAAHVVTGPSTHGGLLPPFRPRDWAHVMPTRGMPAAFDFGWERAESRAGVGGGRGGGGVAAV